MPTDKRPPLPEQPPLHRPASATHPLVAMSGVAGFLLAVIIVRFGRPFGEIYQSTLFVMVMTASAIFLPDLLWQKIYRRTTTAPRSDAPWNRTLTKFAGLLGSIGLVALAYALFPEYHGSFYDNYYNMLELVLGPWLLLAIPYIRWVDRRMAEPEDSLWAMGQLLTLHWGNIDREKIHQHLLAWTVKGFFLPLMFIYACNDMSRFSSYELGHLNAFKPWYDFFYDLFYFIDVGIVAMGYLFALRLTDTHIRSTEPTGLGWGIALLCYEPFWSLIGRQYLAYDAGGGSWGNWLQDQPVLFTLWGCAILFLVMVYVWSTISFGARFSNLTHRGIITSGPYRWLRHPAYLSKNISWWMISVPFLTGSNTLTTVRYCTLLLFLNGVYYLRAKTEERHLSRDPDYIAYSRWIDAHGLLRWLKMPSPFKTTTAAPDTAAATGRSRA
jgi:protein-S-isoprenylcysteine O-methyltransferase Ste14